MAPAPKFKKDQADFILQLNSLDPEKKEAARKKFEAMWVAYQTGSSTKQAEQKRSPVVFHFQSADYYLSQVLSNPSYELPESCLKSLEACQKELHQGHQASLAAQRQLDNLVF